jgi:hypothetical protein
MWLDGE